MSRFATVQQRLQPDTRRAGSRRFLPHDTDAVLLIVVMLVAFALVRALPAAFLQDTWLALVAGREVWLHGIPHHEALTTFSSGARWIDQQWLSQLITYGLWRIGGLGLVGVINVALITSGVGGAVIAARRLGARAPAAIWLLPLCLWPILLTSEIRTQTYAYPIFVACVYLLAADSRSHSRRVYLCLPLLILWANLHGSASLGAGLVMLRALTILWERRDRMLASWRVWIRPLVLAVGPVVCLMITPYGVSTLSYYEQTLFNNSFRQVSSEWQPVTAAPLLAIPFFALAAVTLWSFGRYQRRLTVWERVATAALLIGGIIALRNVVWFALAGLVLLPVSISPAAPAARVYGRTRQRVNAAIGTASLVALVAAVSTALTSHSFGTAYPRGVLSAARAATAADPTIKVVADSKFADWLLWYEPQLRGRVAYDIRFELLGTNRVKELARLYAVSGVDWQRAARGYRLIVLDTSAFKDATRAFVDEPGAEVLYRHDKSMVLLRSAGGAA